MPDRNHVSSDSSSASHSVSIYTICVFFVTSVLVGSRIGAVAGDKIGSKIGALFSNGLCVKIGSTVGSLAGVGVGSLTGMTATLLFLGATSPKIDAITSFLLQRVLE